MAALSAVLVEARVQVPAADWRAAVEAACGPLVAGGAVDATYVRRCIDMVDEHGPYIVLAPGIALAHARPEDGVRRVCLSAITLSEPVRFGHPDNDPVDVIFAFGSPDAEQHVGLLATLARRLGAGLDEQLRASATDAEARALLEAMSDAG